MQLYQGIRDAAELSGVAGDPSFRAKCLAYADTVREVLVREYYDPDAGVFVDNSVSGAEEVSVSQHVNAWAVLSGLAAERDRDTAALLERADDAPGAVKAVAAYMKHWVLAARLEAGRVADSLAWIRKDWGFMLDQGATTCWDLCDPEDWGSYEQDGFAYSQCHGWSAGPAYLLPAFLAGIRPAAPGFGRIVIQPELADLEWVQSEVPTPQGNIYAYWEKDEDGQLTGRVELPDGITAELRLGGELRRLSGGTTIV